MGLSRTSGGIAGIVGVVVVVGLVWFGVSSLDDSSDAQSPEAAGSTSSAAGTKSESISPSATPSETSEAVEPDWKAEAKRAADEDLAVMVPARVPSGWTFDSATFDEADVTWLLVFTSDQGTEVKLAQSNDAGDQGPGGYLEGCQQQQETVDLTDYGTGRWTTYTCPTATVISTEFPSGVVAISAVGVPTAKTLAKQLLTYESPGSTSEND
jgi:hypothetical protein